MCDILMFRIDQFKTKSRTNDSLESPIRTRFGADGHQNWFAGEESDNTAGENFFIIRFNIFFLIGGHFFSI